jgi:hypothetical protein
MRTTIRRASLFVLVLCTCTACASGGGRREAGQPDARVDQNARFVQMTSEPRTDFVFYMLSDSMGKRPGRGVVRVPLAETGILPSYEVAWWPRQ